MAGMDQRLEGDVLVAGSGLSGCATAFFAACQGLKVLLVEKAPLVGGLTTQSGGLMWIGANHLAEQELPDQDDSVEAAADYLRFVGGGQHDEAKVLAFATHGREALR